MSITQEKITQYKTVIQRKFDKSLTPSQLNMGMKDNAIKMMEAESAGDGSTNTVHTTFIGWLKTKPLAMEFLTTPSVACTNFQKVIDGSITFTTAACGLPSTYIALYNEDKTKGPALAGLIALRAAGVDSTYKADGANLAAGSAGTLLSDANVMALYGTWGANKFNAVFNTGTLKSIENESNTSYDTIAEVAALYSSWSNTVPVDTFFNAINKMVSAGVTGLKFSDMISLANNPTNFNLYTSDASATLMASTGGSFSAVTGLGAAEFAALTTPNAVKAIKDGSATYTLLDAVYTADTTKFNSLMSNDAVTLATKGYSGINTSTLSTAYGTTYTVAADVKFNEIVDSANHTLFAHGVTYAHMLAAYNAGKLDALHDPAVQKVLFDDPANCDTNVNVLVGTLANYAGLEAIGFG